MQAKHQHLVPFFIWTHLCSHVWAMRLGWKGEIINVYLSHLREALKCERMEEAPGVLGERKCSGNSFWNLHKCLHTWKKKFLLVLCGCFLGCASLKRHLAEWAWSVCVCRSCWATGIGTILRASAMWMAQMDFLPGDVWEQSAAGYLFCLQAILISCMEVYFIIFSWSVK